jgi:hypothetical protein
VSFRLYASRDLDVVLAFLLIFIGIMASASVLYTLFLQQTDYRQGLGWWLFTFFSFTPWNWTALAMVWVAVGRWLLPQSGIWSPAAATVYATALLTIPFHTAWFWPQVVTGVLCLGVSRWIMPSRM